VIGLRKGEEEGTEKCFWDQLFVRGTPCRALKNRTRRRSNYWSRKKRENKKPLVQKSLAELARKSPRNLW